MPVHRSKWIPINALGSYIAEIPGMYILSGLKTCRNKKSMVQNEPLTFCV